MAHPALLALALGTLGVVAGQLDSSAELWAEPEVPLVEFGGSVRLKLHAKCRGSEVNSSPGMETSLRKRLVEQKPGETVLDLLNVTEWNTSNYIYHTCRKRVKKPIDVVVYTIPAPTLTAVRPDRWRLSCSVSVTAGHSNVTVTLRRGGDILSSRSDRGHSQSQPNTFQLSHEFPARREDHGKSVTCAALLAVSPNQTPLNVTSEPLILDLTALPEGPQLDILQPQELGVPFRVTCTVRPSDTTPEFNVTAANQNFPVTPSHDGHQATAEVTLSRPGSDRVGCAVRVGGVERQTEKIVQVFYVPEPLLNVPSSPLAAGSVLSGNCSLPPTDTKNIQLRILHGDKVLVAWGQPPLPFHLMAQEGDNGTELSCEAELRNYSRIPKKTSVPIVVHVHLWLDDSGCPGQQNWTEGQQEVLQCQARGRAEPQVRCSKDGNSLTAGIPYPASRSHAGTYLCSVTNALGTAERNVTVHVQVPPPFPLLAVLLGVLLPAAALLTLAGIYLLYHRNTKIGEYWLWRKQRQPVEMKPLRSPGSSEAAGVPNGSGAP